jgi:hypothetical protein
MYPTDITVYEDETLMISDYSQPKIYKYNFAYDYAIVGTSYDNLTQILLREDYNDVDL